MSIDAYINMSMKDIYFCHCQQPPTLETGAISNDSITSIVVSPIVALVSVILMFFNCIAMESVQIAIQDLRSLNTALSDNLHISKLGSVYTDLDRHFRAPDAPSKSPIRQTHDFWPGVWTDMSRRTIFGQMHHIWK